MTSYAAVHGTLLRFMELFLFTPEIKAIAACKRLKAKLVIAKLDRLSRNLAFIAALMESGVEFVAVDNPHMNKLTIHILAAVAEHEREMISERTKAALAAAKRRGQRLGNPNLTEVAKRGTATGKANARRSAANVRPIIDEIMRARATSHNAIAGKLNERNVRTARGGKWTHVQVGAILHPFWFPHHSHSCFPIRPLPVLLWAPSPFQRSVAAPFNYSFRSRTVQVN
jgi:Resolvase, N terminal domain/Recombinase